MIASWDAPAMGVIRAEEREARRRRLNAERRRHLRATDPEYRERERLEALERSRAHAKVRVDMIARLAEIAARRAQEVTP